MKILYVEDNPANVFLVKRVARMGNHEIINYIDGDKAIENFLEISPDLVLMDIQLAGNKSGLDVVKSLREQGIKTPIVAVTAYAMVGDKERCLAAGCDDYLPKPLPIQRLVEMFKQYSESTPATETKSADTTDAPVATESKEDSSKTTQPVEAKATDSPVADATSTPATDDKTAQDDTAKTTATSTSTDTTATSTTDDKPALSDTVKTTATSTTDDTPPSVVNATTPPEDDNKQSADDTVVSIADNKSGETSVRATEEAQVVKTSNTPSNSTGTINTAETSTGE